VWKKTPESQCCHFSLFETKSGLFWNRFIYFFGIWFTGYFFSLFLYFWFVFSFFKDVLRRVSTVFPAMIYVWFRRFKENLSKLLDSLLLLATVCSKISLYQQEQILYNRWHVMYRSWFFECKTLFRLWNVNFDKKHGLFWVRRGIRDKSKRCLNLTLSLLESTGYQLVQI